ncbi:MAG: hypothetical protein ACKVG0_15495 [Alphaproteobacteria bacterium]|jgi:2-methylcitrate dehydratase PrpD
MSNTQYILDFVINAKFSDSSEQARTEAKMGMSDCMGVTLAGAKQDAGQIGADWAKAAQGAEQATV